MEDISRLHLVQRVELRPVGERSPARGLIDGVFRFDYMGSAEFEFGALPAALKEMRTGPALPAPVKLTSQDYEAWYVGQPKFQPVAQKFFNHELGDDLTPPYRLQECSSLRRSYIPNPRDSRHALDGWWCVDAGRVWAMFRTKETADLWLLGVKT